MNKALAIIGGSAAVMALQTAVAWAGESIEAREAAAMGKEEQVTQQRVEPVAGDGGEGPLQLNLDLGVLSAYVFRGINVFQDDSQHDQTLFLAPAATLSIGDTGLSIGYWGAYQVTGDDIGDKNDAGLGAEQNLILGYELALNETLALNAGFTYYFFPFADSDVAGTSVPSYLEPAVGLAWAGPVDLSMNVSYFYGVQEAIEAGRYVYFNPRVAKNVPLNQMLELDLDGGAGYKLFNDSDIDDNTWDVILKAALTITPQPSYYITPSISLAWTNLESESFGDELVVFGGVNVGVNL